MSSKRSDGLGAEEMTITPLGAGSEVGRSCIIVRFKGKTIMLDCGVHPAYSGIGALPYFDEIDPEKVDLVLITHFHLDHAAGLPYFTEKTGFKGRVFMTHPTKAIFKWMLSDYVKVSSVAGGTNEGGLYTEAELNKCYERISTIDYHQEIDVAGIRFTALNAGHVLGAAMFVIEIAGVRLLYTGDYSREEDRHLMAAETPSSRPEVLICESTYGVQMHQPRLERERRFTGMVHDVVKRGGKCLIPVFALGRAQELLLILDEYWQAHPDLHPIPVYYASPMANKCMAVYQTYVNMMNDHIRRQISVNNPFIFKHIKYLKGNARDALKDGGPCVVMASPGMLQNGLSRELFEAWAPHRQNGLIIPGYVVEGTMGKYVLTGPNEITSLAGQQIPLRMSVEYISFSAHVDFAQNAEFIDILRPPHLVLVHGEANEMGRLKAALNHKYAHLQGKEDVEEGGKRIITIYTPRNCEDVNLSFAGEKLLKLAGKLAKRPLHEGDTIEGLLVGSDFDYQIVQPDDLAQLSTTAKVVKLLQSQTVTCRATLSLIEHLLCGLIGSSKIERTKNGFRIRGSFDLTRRNKDTITLSWEGNVLDDLFADSIISLLVSAEVLPSSVKACGATKCSHSHVEEEPTCKGYHAGSEQIMNIIKEYLEGYYGPVQINIDGYHFTLDGEPVMVDIESLEVTCEDEEKKEKITKALHKISSIISVNYII